MTANNQQMTSEQLADLSTLAAQLQAKAEANDDRDTAVMAYAVQRACSGLEESRREFRAEEATINNLEQRLAAVVAENAALKQTESNLVRNIINDLGDTEFQYSRVQTPETDAFLAEVRARVWSEAKELAKSAVSSDSIDHIDFLFDGKAAQLRQGAE